MNTQFTHSEHSQRNNVHETNQNTSDSVDNAQFNCTRVNKTTNVNYLGLKVINLSNASLTDDQIKVLEKGITFVPTPDRVNIGEIHYYVSRF